MPDSKDEIVAVTGAVTGSSTSTGSISATSQQLSGTIEATVNEDGALQGTSGYTASLSTLTVSDQIYSGSVSALRAENAATNATLTLRIGADGYNGKDGFSPFITVYKDSKTEYILKVTNADGSYLTPNLYPDLEGLQDIEALVASKLDKDLTNGEYPTTDPMTLTTYQRDNSYMYLEGADKTPRKVSLSSIALEQDVADRFRTKIRTTTERPSDDWRVGDYIFLETNQEESE